MRADLRPLLFAASFALAGADWPGRERELLGSFSVASPARKVEILREIASSPGSLSEQTVVSALSDAEESVQLTAAELAGTYRMKTARSVLLQWLSDNSPDKRAVAVQALGQIADPETLSSVVRLLGDADTRVRLNAVNAIAKMGGTTATVPLLDRLVDAENSVRLAAARVLGEIGDPRAVLPLLGTLQDSMPEVREESATALGRLHDARAVRGLLGLLRDNTLEVRLAATRALGSLGAPEAVVDLVPLALMEDRASDDVSKLQVARVAIDSMGRIGGVNARDVLVRVMRRATRNELIVAAANALVRLGPIAEGAIPALVSEAMRGQVLVPVTTVLGEIGGEAATDALIGLQESAAGVAAREAILRELGHAGTQRAMRSLLRTLANAVDTLAELDIPPSVQPTTQSDQVRALFEIRRGSLAGLEAYAQRNGRLDAEAMDPLAEVLNDAIGGITTEPGRQFLRRLIDLLGQTQNPRAATVLGPLLRVSANDIRRAAARALMMVGTQGIVSQLVDALSDLDPEVRIFAADTLARHGDEESLQALITAWKGTRPIDRAHAARAMGRVGARAKNFSAVSLLAGGVGVTSEATDAAILDALSSLAEVGSADALAALMRSSSDLRLGPAAVEAMGNALLKSEAAQHAGIVRALQSATSVQLHPAVRATAVWALGQTSDVPLVQFRQWFSDSDALVVTNAAGALARRLAAGEKLPDDAFRLSMCRVLETRPQPTVRANVLMALANAGAQCDVDREREMLRQGRAAFVRSAAARAIAAIARGSGEDAGVARGTLLECAAGDRSPMVAGVCRSLSDALPAPSSSETETPAAQPTQQLPQAPRADESIDVVLTSDDAVGVAVMKTFGVVMNDGITRVGLTGPGGWVHERHAPAGRFDVVDPDELVPEP